MNLRSVDLNLLVALEALLRERHVTRAADRIGLSQPAMSNALGRLRHIFGDDLLVRTAKGMQPTPRAEELLEQTQQLLKQIERVLENDGSFQAKTSKRKFSVRMSDLLGMLLLPNLLEDLRKSAPCVGLDIVHLPPARTVDALERDEIDVAVSMGLEHSHVILSKVLFTDSMVCVMSKNHALAKKTLTLDNLLAYRHLKVSMSPTDLRFVDDVLSRMRLARDVALNVPHWLVVPHVLARTDYLAVMSGRLARKIAGRTLVIKDLPFASQLFDWSVYWHRRHNGNQAITWLRKLIFDSAAELCVDGSHSSLSQ
jgi:DNA-binding transcriptional LysR family regulator